MGHCKNTIIFLLLVGSVFGANVVKHGADVKLTGDEAKLWFFNGTNWLTIAASGSLVTDTGYTWPPAFPVSGGQALLSSTGGVMSWGTPSTAASHDLLGPTHDDTATSTPPTRGSIIYATSAPEWDELVIGSANLALVSDGTDIAWTDKYLRNDADDTTTGVLTVEGLGTGGQTDYDLKVGDVDGSPTYGMIQIGNACIGRTSFKAGNIDLDGSIIYRNISGPVTSEIEHVFVESTGDSTRFALPKSAVGNATYNSRSMFLAGPAPADTDYVKVSYWQSNNNIFDNLACDTIGTGADLGVQNDLEVEGDIFCDSFKESTSGAGYTFSPLLDISDNTNLAVDTDHLKLTDDTLSFSDTEKTVSHSRQGSFLEQIDFTVSEAGGTVTGSLEKEGGGDLTQFWSDDFDVLDCTGPVCTVNLTAFVGTDTSPATSFVYILQSAKTTLVANTSFPANSVEHIRICSLVLQSAATTGTEGALMVRNWNDPAFGITNPRGGAVVSNERLREEHALHDSGVVLTVTGSGTGTVTLDTTAGEVYQLNLQAFPAIDMAGADNIHLVNLSGGEYSTTSNLVTGITTLADAVTALGNNKYFNIVVWGVQNRTGETSHLMCNLPTGQYNSSLGGTTDSQKFSVHTIPSAFRGTGFLIAELTFQLTGGGTTWTLVQNKDLLGQIPTLVPGGGTTTAISIFSDASFELFDNGDVTKRMDFQLSGITTGNARTITMADRNLDLADPVFDSVAVDNVRLDGNQITTTSGDLTLNATDDVVCNKDYDMDTNNIINLDAITGTGAARFDGGVGVGMAPTSTRIVSVRKDQDAGSLITTRNENAGTDAFAMFQAFTSSSEAIGMIAHGDGRTITRLGVTLGGYGEFLTTGLNGLLIDTLTANTPIIIGTETLRALKIDGTNQDILLGNDDTDHAKFDATGNQTFVGAAGFYPRRLSQAAAPASGTGATQIDTGEMIIWRDSGTGEVHIVYNDTTSGIVISEFLGED